MSEFLAKRLPAEWEPQSAVLLTWPHSKTDWAPILDEVKKTYSELIQLILKYEACILIAANDDEATALKAQFASEAPFPLHVLVHETNDTWIRDYGPISIVDHEGKLRCLDFSFNAWGGKFESLKDNELNQVLFKQLKQEDRRVSIPEMILEGGSIESDGAGSLLTTSACLLNPNRNRDQSQEDIECSLKEMLGISRVLWLENGHLAGDDTDSHIDTLARFCSENMITYMSCDDPQDEHYKPLKAMEKDLQSLRRLDGSPYQLVPLPWPEAQYDPNGERLPATYANFLILNGAVIVPSYNCPQDEIALKTIASLFPDRQCHELDASILIREHGSIHCISMQIPEGLL